MDELKKVLDELVRRKILHRITYLEIDNIKLNMTPELISHDLNIPKEEGNEIDREEWEREMYASSEQHIDF